MRLSDSESRKQLAPRKRRAVGAEGKHWSDSQKLEAVSLFLTLGSHALTCATLKIPDDTLRRWRRSEWWKEAEQELKLQDQIQFSASAKKIIEKSMGAVLDRLEHGDWIYDQKTGKMKRKPVAMKDALAAANSMMEKKIILDKQDVRVETTEGIDAKLTKLMEKFAQMNKPQVTDVVYVQEEKASAVHEERKEGLQQGISGISQPSGAEEESFGTDSGTPGGQ